jgi:hypothetical protein
MHVGFARVIWAEYIAPYSITDRGIAPESCGRAVRDEKYINFAVFFLD